MFPQSNPNSIYLEFLGNGMLYSINYDRMVAYNFGGKIGLSYLSFHKGLYFEGIKTVIFPISVNYFIGEGSSKLELGAGITLVNGTYNSWQLDHSWGIVFNFLNIGFRYQPTNGGFMFRIFYSPMYVSFGSGGYHHWGGLSFGQSF